MKSLFTKLTRTVCGMFLAVTPITVSAADLLSIGSDAPPLDVEHWVQNGNGKFQPVTKFEAGKVYVVEFWATWCGPCVASMPHLAEIQNDYADKGVQIVSVSDEDLETVENFLAREVRNAAPTDEADADEESARKKTYRDLTSAYCLTTDPDRSVYEDYMVAAAQNGIPTAFIVGKDSKIEWIGHPVRMDEPLEAVVTDSWDREAFREQMEAEQRAQQAMQEIYALLQEEKLDEALEKIEAALEDGGNMQLNILKLQVLLAGKKNDAAKEHLSSLFDSLKDEPAMVNMVAWNIYETAAQGRADESLIKATIPATEKAVELAPEAEKASILDTLAHLHYLLGDLDKAIELETEALRLSGDRDREFIQQFFDQLMSEKKAQSDGPQTTEIKVDDK